MGLKCFCIVFHNALSTDQLRIWLSSCENTLETIKLVRGENKVSFIIFSGGSVYNLYADDEDETEASPSGQQIIENSITMNKMKLLKAKMENMNLSKKVKVSLKFFYDQIVCTQPVWAF